MTETNKQNLNTHTAPLDPLDTLPLATRERITQLTGALICEMMSLSVGPDGLAWNQAVLAASMAVRGFSTIIIKAGGLDDAAVKAAVTAAIFAGLTAQAMAIQVGSAEEFDALVGQRDSAPLH